MYLENFIFVMDAFDRELFRTGLRVILFDGSSTILFFFLEYRKLSSVAKLESICLIKNKNKIYRMCVVYVGKDRSGKSLHLTLN